MSNVIKVSDLPKIWSAPDNKRLISKQISIRLPIHVAAKIYALEALYPNKTRTELINDLLSTALEDVGEALPSEKGPQIGEFPIFGDELQPVYQDIGLRGRYYELFSKYLFELEKEAGNTEQIPQYEGVISGDDSREIITTRKTSNKK